MTLKTEVVGTQNSSLSIFEKSYLVTDTVPGDTYIRRVCLVELLQCTVANLFPILFSCDFSLVA